MDFWLRNLCVFLFLAFSVIISSVSTLQLSDCTEFKVIPPDQYDRNPSSADDITKRPLGYMYANVLYPGVQSEIKNPCVYVKNLTSRDIEVMIQALVPGTVCVRDDSKPTPKSNCAQGGTLSVGCWNPTTDTVMFEFYCDPGAGCDADVQFWYRLTPSPPGADVDDWCNARSSEFPQDLITAPPPVNNKPTVKSEASGIVSWSILFALVLFLVHFVTL
ncbi:hypothetical protein ACROYT_G034275 [Oculina patagonica]